MNHKFKNHKHTISFKRAIDGLFLAWRTQPNFKIISFFTLAVCFLSYLFKLDFYQWILVIIAVFVVIICEMINTSIEAMVDLITTEWKEDAKIAKDISSGMVLMAVIFSTIIGFLVFGPKIIKFF